MAMNTGTSTLVNSEGKTFVYDCVEINGCLTMTGPDGVFEYVMVESNVMRTLERRLEESAAETNRITAMIQEVRKSRRKT